MASSKFTPPLATADHCTRPAGLLDSADCDALVSSLAAALWQVQPPAAAGKLISAKDRDAPDF
jgi:hypothetical protein